MSKYIDIGKFEEIKLKKSKIGRKIYKAHLQEIMFSIILLKYIAIIFIFILYVCKRYTYMYIHIHICICIKDICINTLYMFHYICLWSCFSNGCL